MTCSKPSFAYGLGQFSPFHPPLFMTGLNFLSDINGLVGNKLPVEIPQWYTKPFALHILDFVFVALSTVIGLLQYLFRDEDWQFRGLALSVILLALAQPFSVFTFAFDLSGCLKTRNKIKSIGWAEPGPAFWFNIVSWFLSGVCIWVFFAVLNVKRKEKDRQPSNDIRINKTGAVDRWSTQRVSISVSPSVFLTIIV